MKYSSVGQPSRQVYLYDVMMKITCICLLIQKAPDNISLSISLCYPRPGGGGAVREPVSGILSRTVIREHGEITKDVTCYAN